MGSFVRVLKAVNFDDESTCTLSHKYIMHAWRRTVMHTNVTQTLMSYLDKLYKYLLMLVDPFVVIGTT